MRMNRYPVRRRARRASLVALLAVTAALIFVAVEPAREANALSGSEFQPGNIIVDDLFYDSDAMSEAEIQAFLEARIGPCTNANCLDIYRQDTVSKDPVAGLCAAYEGAPGELASTIIFKVQRACGISAKVLLVILQKEQSLVTHTGPSDARLSRAMGYGCPDSAGGACDARYYGFYNQVYMAAWQFERYRVDHIGQFQPGTTREIYYHPSLSTCGTRTVAIQNFATAGLYNYTPYTPNDAALANLGALGDSCSSYGNRNFWVYYNNWFGDSLTTVPPGVTVSRLGGQDRYDVSVAISQANFAGTSSTVYVATGTNFPDALSAAPAAAKAQAPLLLVPVDSLPPTVKAEIERLSPDLIIVAGGPASVSPGVYDQLALLAPEIRRDDGLDRYESSRAVTRDAFGDSGATIAYLATGENFPDALSASAAAGFRDAPVILIRGTATSLDTETPLLLAELGVTEVIIAGGPATVLPVIEDQLRALPGITTVRRLGGEDRFNVSGNTNRDAFSSSARVYIASGYNYPDALSGAAVAGAQGAPLYVIPTECIPSYVLDDIVSFGASEMIIFGGPATVAPSVEAFARCG